MTTKKQFLDQVKKASRLANAHSKAADVAKDMLYELLGATAGEEIVLNDECGFIDAVDYGCSFTMKEVERLLNGERW